MTLWVKDLLVTERPSKDGLDSNVLMQPSVLQELAWNTSDCDELPMRRCMSFEDALNQATIDQGLTNLVERVDVMFVFRVVIKAAVVLGQSLVPLIELLSTVLSASTTSGGGIARSIVASAMYDPVVM